MIRVIHFYLVLPAKTRGFVAALRDGAAYTAVRRRFPQLVAVDLLGSRAYPGAYISMEFWTSDEAYRSAANSSEVKELSRLLEGLFTDCVDLGAFALPPRDDAESALQTISSEPAGACPSLQEMEVA